MILVWTITRCQYRFRIATAPFPVQPLSLGAISFVGFAALLTDLCLLRASLASPEGQPSDAGRMAGATCGAPLADFSNLGLVRADTAADLRKNKRRTLRADTLQHHFEGLAIGATGRGGRTRTFGSILDRTRARRVEMERHQLATGSQMPLSRTAIIANETPSDCRQAFLPCCRRSLASHGVGAFPRDWRHTPLPCTVGNIREKPDLCGLGKSRLFSLSRSGGLRSRSARIPQASQPSDVRQLPDHRRRRNFTRSGLQRSPPLDGRPVEGTAESCSWRSTATSRSDSQDIRTPYTERSGTLRKLLSTFINWTGRRRTRGTVRLFRNFRSLFPL